MMKTPKTRYLSPKSRLKLQHLLIALLLPATLSACMDAAFFIHSPHLPFNFYELDSGKAYRSAQPTGEELEKTILMFGIKTVVNLRGPNSGKEWYDQEVEICRQMGVTLVDHRMSGGSLPSPELLEAIFETFSTAEYPLLIHCQGGADRTGAVSALYRMIVAGDEKSVALRQLSPRYFHFQSRMPCMRYFIEIFEPSDEWFAAYAQEYSQLDCGGK